MQREGAARRRIVRESIRSAGRKVLAVVAAVPFLVLVYAMLVVPGWQPGGRTGFQRYARLAAFLLLAIVVGVCLAVFAT